MAIPSWDSKGAEAEGSNVNSRSIVAPATINAGDLLVAHVSYLDAGEATLSSMTGFDTLGGKFANGCGILVLYKIADGTEDSSSITCTLSQTVDVMHCVMHRFIGAVENAVDTGAVDTNSGYGNRSTNSFTTARTDSVVVWMWTSYNDWPAGTPISYIQRSSESTSQGSDSRMLLNTYDAATAETVVPGDSQSGSGADAFSGITFEVFSEELALSFVPQMIIY